VTGQCAFGHRHFPDIPEQLNEPRNPSAIVITNSIKIIPLHEKTYAPHSIEQRWYTTWEENGYFSAGPEGESYCIMIPPPNVTGSLHMGHAFRTRSWTP